MKLTKAFMISALVTLVAAACASQPAQLAGVTVATVDSEQARFALVEVVSGLDHPWSMAFLPSGDILVTERPGRLLRVSSDGVHQIAGVPDVVASGQGGLLDVVLHPEYEQTGWIYLTYSSRYDGGYGTTLARARLDADRLVGTEELFRINRATTTTRHFGSRLVFGTDGLLYMTVGDRGARDRAQEQADHAGSVLRLTEAGVAAPGNPFAGDGGALDEIYSYGHRNAQGIDVHPETGEIWLHEHGPQGGDEVNVVKSGANFGWPIVSYGDEYGSGIPVSDEQTDAAVEDVVLYWKPSIAPSGMTFYDDSAFPQWRGDLFVGALAGRHLRRVELDGTDVVSQEILLENTIGRVRDVRSGPDGAIYVLTDEDPGGLYRLEPAQ